MNLFAADSALYGSLISVQRAAAELKIEFLEELSATVSFVEQITDRVYMCRFKASSLNILAISAFLQVGGSYSIASQLSELGTQRTEVYAIKGYLTYVDAHIEESVKFKSLPKDTV